VDLDIFLWAVQLVNIYELDIDALSHLGGAIDACRCSMYMEIFL
jgi:hypothetical protein